MQNCSSTSGIRKGRNSSRGAADEDPEAPGKHALVAVVGEFIGAEYGIGRLIIESEARAEASRMMMVAVIVLRLVGVALAAVIWRLQAYLLRWQQHSMAE